LIGPGAGGCGTAREARTMGTKGTRKASIKAQIADLRCDCVNATPIDFDFGEVYGETWETVDPDLSSMSAEQIRELASDHGVDLDDLPADPDEFEEWTAAAADKLLESLRDNDDLAPIMNYTYPIDGCNLESGEVQARLLGLPLVAVTIGGETRMALSGGGMDFSWQICEAYTRIGLLPPVHFRPPMSCENPDDPTIRLVAAAYLKSCTVAGNCARGAARDMRRTMQRLREHKAEREAHDATIAKPKIKRHV
jgi:hypothetical protein